MLILISGSGGAALHYNITPIDVDKSNINDLSYVPGKSTLLAVTDAGDLLIYDLDGNMVHHEEFPVSLYSVDVQPSGGMAATGGRAGVGINAILYIVSPITGQITKEISTGHGSIYCIEFSHDSSLLVVTTGDGTLLLFNTTTFAIHREKALGEKIFSASFSPDDDGLVIGDAAGRLHIYWPGNDTLRSTTAHTDMIYDTLWLDSNTVISSGKDGVIKKFDAGLIEKKVLTEHDDTVYCLGGTPDGRYVLSGGKDGKTIIWDMLDYSVLFELGSAKYSVESNAVSRDGRYGCYGISDSQIFVVSFDPDGDGFLLLEDGFPTDPRAAVDSDGDGSPDLWNEWKLGEESTSGLHIDSFPLDPAASLDTDGDGFPDEWNLGKSAKDSTAGLERVDAFPIDPVASLDTDGDGSPDEWNKGESANKSTSGLHIDQFPNDPAASLDADEDGFPDEWNPNMTIEDSSSNISRLDAFPNDPAASMDTDGDGSPDEWNAGKNKGDSTTRLELDDFPHDPDEWADSDWPFADGIGDNADWFPGFNNLVFYILLAALTVLLIMIIVRKSRSRTEKVNFTAARQIHNGKKMEQKSIAMEDRRKVKMKAVDGRIKRIVPNFLITHKLGSGSFASVYRANGLDGGKVALKLPKLLGETLDSSIYEKFESEARIWKKLDHPNIVELYDAGTDPIPYMAMELMEGGNLKQLLDERQLSVEESVNIILGLLDAMSFAHRMATVHRDIKPENILFTRGGRPKISDWGIGKFMASESVTESSGHKGTLAYSAPEQISPKNYGKVDWSTDLFQLGTVFYEMLTGVNPFMAEDPAEVISNILYTDVEPPSFLDDSIPRVLDEIVMRALERVKQKRWRSTDVMYDRLKRMVK